MIIGGCEDIKEHCAGRCPQISPERWCGFSVLLGRIRPRFARYEPARQAGALMLGLLSGLDRKNCWTIAERRGDVNPDGLQHLLSRAR